MEKVPTGSIPSASEDAERAFSRAGLTPREVSAARSLLAGMTSAEASRVMGVGASTVSSYRRRAYEKLGVSDAVELRQRFAPAAVPSDVAGSRDRLIARGLSDTEASVLSAVARGLTSAQIASDLGLAPGTVSAARAHGYRHLGVHSRGELVRLLAEDRGEEEGSRRRGVFVAANVAVVVACLAYGAAYLIALRQLGQERYESVWGLVFSQVSCPALALCAAHLVGLALSRHRVARALPVRPGLLAAAGAVFAVCYAVLLATLCALSDQWLFEVVWYLSAGSGYVVEVVVGLMAGLGWGGVLRGER